MAQSNAERQRAYRQRQQTADDGSCLLSMRIAVHAKAALGRLARHTGTTQRAVLERLLSEADGHTAGRLRGKAQTVYYDGGVTR